MARKIKEEDLRLNIIVNGDDGRKKMLDLEKSIEETSRSIRKLTEEIDKETFAENKNTAKIKELRLQRQQANADLKEQKRRLADIRKQMDINSMTLDELRRHINKTRRELEVTVPNTDQWNKLNRVLVTARNRYAELYAQTTATNKTMCSMVATVNQYMQSLIGGVYSVSKFVGVVRQATDKYLEYDEALTDAMKTTNLTKDEVTELSDELAKIDTRTAQNELLSLARIGGKLGISGQENLLGFVRAADKINVALKEDLGGDAEAAIAAIGKMVDIFSLEKEFGIEQSILKVGSAVNSLGMASTANEGYIVDFTKRLAGIAPNANISIDKVLGLAATLDKYGQTSEMSATAIGQTIMAMFKRTETFAGIAKMSLEEFTNLLNKDVNEAFIRVLEGMKGADGGLADIVQSMNGMKLDGQRASQVLGTMAKHTDELRAQQELANRSFREGTSVIDEFEVKNSSVTAQFEKQKKAIEANIVAIGQQLLPVVNGAMDVANVGVSVLSSLVKLLIEYRGVVIALATVVASHKAAEAAMVPILKAKVLWQAAYTKAQRASIIATRQAKAATVSYMVVMKALKSGFLSAAGAVKAFGVVLLTTPIGWITMGLSALVAGISLLATKSKEAREAQERLNESNKQLTDTMTDATARIDKEKESLEYLKKKILEAKEGTDERKEAIRRLNEKYGEYLPNLLTERDDNNKVAEALEEVNRQLERKIKLQARETEDQRLYQERMENVKKTVAGYAALYREINGKDMTPEMQQDLAKTVLDYSGRRSSPNADNSSDPYGYDFSSEGLGKFGLDFQSIGKRKTGKKALGLLQTFIKSQDDNARQRNLLDTYYGTMDSLAPDPNPKTDDANNGDDDNNAGDGKWSLDKDEKHMQQVIDLKNRYADKEIASEEEYKRQLLELEIRSLEDRIASNQESGEELLKIKNQLADKRIALEELTSRSEEKMAKDSAALIDEVNQDKIAAENRRYQEELKKFKGNAAALEAVERKHQARVAKIRLDAFGAAEAQAKTEYEAELTRLKNRLEAKEITEEQYRNDVLAANADYADKLRELIKQVAVLDGTHVRFNIKGLSDADYADLMLKIQNLIAKQHELANPDAGSGKGGSKKQEQHTVSEGTGDGTFWGLSQEEWIALFDPATGGAERLAGAVTAIGAAAQDAMKLTSMWMDNMARKENEQLKAYQKSNDKKKKALKDRLDAGLITQSQYNAETEAMDAEYDAYQEELQLKQAKRQKQMQLTQAIINTALGVTMTLAQFGVPWGLIPAGIMAAMGAAEIAMIASQPITAGAEEGGYGGEVIRAQDGKKFKARLSPDKRGFVDSPTLLVSENGREYVIPKDGLDNPTLLPFINTMETARRNGQLKSLNFESVYPMSVIGRASGGYVSDGPASAEAVQFRDLSNPELIKAIDMLVRKLDDPILAYVTMLGKNGIVEQTEKYNRLKKFGKL